MVAAQGSAEVREPLGLCCIEIQIDDLAIEAAGSLSGCRKPLQHNAIDDEARRSGSAEVRRMMLLCAKADTV